jgi:hypothetical protein
MRERSAMLDVSDHKFLDERRQIKKIMIISIVRLKIHTHTHTPNTQQNPHTLHNTHQLVTCRFACRG